jgi:glycerophosphoryl diester phosphodiesterase
LPWLITGPGTSTHAQLSSNTPVIARNIIQLDRPIVIAHRGYSQIAPENTLPAFHLALSAGADLVELDYHHTQDNVPVVIHDATLDRTTDLHSLWNQTNVAVANRTATDIALLDAGTWFSPLYARTTIPLLSQALDLIQASAVTLIEHKSGDATTLINLLRNKNLLDHVVVQSFDWSFLRQCRDLAPNLVLGALGPPSTRNGRELSDSEKWLNPTFLAEIQTTGAQIVVWNSRIAPDIPTETHHRNLRLWVYTINEPAAAALLVSLGVNGIITDNPALIWKGLATLSPAHASSPPDSP